MKTIHILMAAAAALASTGSASAALSDTVEFQGEVSAACDVSVQQNGTLGLAEDGQSMSSLTVDGGTKGSVLIRADDGFAVTLASPTVATTASYTDYVGDSSGSVNGAPIAEATPVALAGGDNTVDVNVQIERGDGTDFIEGQYTASVLVTCEPAAVASPQ